MRRFSIGGVYANNLGEEGTDRIQAAYELHEVGGVKKEVWSNQFLPLESEHKARTVGDFRGRG
jgi:hypothetical protein